MGIAGVLSVFVEKKKEKPWEVVDSKSVEPVPLFDEEDGAYTLFLPQRVGALRCASQTSISFTSMRRGSSEISFSMYEKIRIWRTRCSSLNSSSSRKCKERVTMLYGVKGALNTCYALRICVTNYLMVPQVAANPPPQSQTTSGRSQIHRTACLSHREASTASPTALHCRSRGIEAGLCCCVGYPWRGLPLVVICLMYLRPLHRF
jgi:hypothetical protein